MRYSRGDEVILRVEDDFGHTDKVYRPAKVMVIGWSTDTDSSDLEYLCYVPPYVSVPNSFPIRQWHLKTFGTDKKFLDDTGCYINAWTRIYKHIPTTPGERCRRCDEFTAYATLEGGTYFCRACKENPYR